MPQSIPKTTLKHHDPDQTPTRAASQSSDPSPILLEHPTLSHPPAPCFFPLSLPGGKKKTGFGRKGLTGGVWAPSKHLLRAETFRNGGPDGWKQCSYSFNNGGAGVEKKKVDGRKVNDLDLISHYKHNHQNYLYSQTANCLRSKYPTWAHLPSHEPLSATKPPKRPHQNTRNLFWHILNPPECLSAHTHPVAQLQYII
jgi:hypothetical protein